MWLAWYANHDCANEIPTLETNRSIVGVHKLHPTKLATKSMGHRDPTAPTLYDSRQEGNMNWWVLARLWRIAFETHDTELMENVQVRMRCAFSALNTHKAWIELI